jgi:hypothetical protein
MNDYQISTYGLPGLTDIATLRLPTASAPVAERWLTGQGGRILSNAPVRSGGQVIRFEDPTYQSIIEKLRAKAQDYSDLTEVVDEVAQNAYTKKPIRDYEISRQAYDSLQNLKAQGAPQDFIDRILAAPDRNWDVNNQMYSLPEETKIRKGYERLGIPIERVDKSTLLDTWLSRQSGPISEAQKIANPKFVFDPTKGRNGTMFLPNWGNEFRHADNTNLIRGLTDGIIDASNSVADHGYPGQVIINTGARNYVGDSRQGIDGIHNAATRFAIEKNIFEDQRKLRDSFSTMMNHIKYANPDYASYVAQPEFRNQIRTAGRFAGSLFA